MSLFFNQYMFIAGLTNKQIKLVLRGPKFTKTLIFSSLGKTKRAYPIAWCLSVCHSVVQGKSTAPICFKIGMQYLRQLPQDVFFIFPIGVTPGPWAIFGSFAPNLCSSTKKARWSTNPRVHPFWIKQGVYNSGSSGKKKVSGNSGNSRPTFMNKVNNFFTWRNTCLELKK